MGHKTTGPSAKTTPKPPHKPCSKEETPAQQGETTKHRQLETNTTNACYQTPATGILSSPQASHNAGAHTDKQQQNNKEPTQVSKLRTILALTALAIVAIAATATTAGATTSLPSILLLSGTEAELTSSSTTIISLFHGAILIEGEGYKFALKAKAAMTSLGTGLLVFLKAKSSAGACNSLGAPAGEVAVPIEWHTVLAATELGTKVFMLLILIIPSPFDFDCGVTLVFLSGSSLVKAGNLKEDTTAFTGETGECSGTTPAFKEYLNDEGKRVVAKLSAEIAEIKGAACEEVNTKGASIPFTASSMLEVMEP
jgi:hypothetical protein